MAFKRGRCCISKARDPPALMPSSTLRHEQARRSELEATPLRELRKQAKALGMPAKHLEEAMGADDPEGTLIGYLLDEKQIIETHSKAGAAQERDVCVGSKELRTELADLKLGALQKRATAEGVDAETIAEALDSDAPRHALVAAIMAAMSQELSAVEAADAARENLRTELSMLKLGVLQQKAAVEGAGADAVADALDADDPKVAVINLLIELMVPQLDTAALAAAGAADARRKEQLDAARTELCSLTLGNLHKKAVAEGLGDDMIAEALDADDPKAAVVELLVELIAPETVDENSAAVEVAFDAAEVKRAEELTTELSALKLKALKKRAKSCGVSEQILEDADDADDVRRAVIQLIAAAERGTTSHSPLPVIEAGGAQLGPVVPQDKPHFGSTDSNVPHVAAPIPARHVMLSYQWDQQNQVMRVHELLTKLGFKCWMDVFGGMGEDIYDSMAEGVSNASVVVCFMSQKYQESDNCKLELRFAKQTGKAIVPVLANQSPGWRASGWLGLITAGLLWTPLMDETFEENVDAIASQIKLADPDCTATGTTADVPAESRGDDLFSVGELREELERLRADSRKLAVHERKAPGELCTLPAIVPDMGDDLVVSDSMHKLVDTVIAVSSKRRCGFWGSGGIGKTTASAWLCRQERIRRHFDTIAWVTLSQTPNILACQRQLFVQLTGKQLPQELKEEDRRREIQEAFVGKQCLLVLDDAWDSDLISHFALIDETTHSRVLISSRVVSTLESCDVVDIGLPTEDDAIQMIMGAAGMTRAGGVPEEAREVALLCKQLPLTLGIAGRLIKGLDLQDDWSEVVAMMKEELSVDGEARSAEDRVIATSLREIKGRDADGARALFKAFRLVPEDVKVPLEALAWMYEASNGIGIEGSDGGATPTMIQLRKWTKMLIDRCLVLGPMETPGLHDIVKDYADSMESDTVTKSAHRRFVNILRGRRPQSTESETRGRAGWEPLSDDRAATYIVSNCTYHVQSAWQSDWAADQECICWMSDYHMMSDAIPLACARALGREKVSHLAQDASEHGDWWSAALRWSATALDIDESVGKTDAKPLYVQCAACLEHVVPQSPEQQRSKDRLEFTTVLAILMQWNPPDMPLYMPRLATACTTEVAKEDPESLARGVHVTEYYPNFFAAHCGDERNLKLFAQGGLKHSRTLTVPAQNLPVGSFRRTIYLAEGLGFSVVVCASFFVQYCDATWDDVCGDGGSFLLELATHYEFDTMHQRVEEVVSFDGMCSAALGLPLLLHYGDLAASRTVMDSCLANVNRLCELPNAVASFSFLHSCLSGPIGLLVAGRSADAAEIMAKMKVDWPNAGDTVAIWEKAQPIVGEDSSIKPSSILWMLRVVWGLVGNVDKDELEQFAATLPSPRELALHDVVHVPQFGMGPFSIRLLCGYCSLLWPALLWERLGKVELALECCALVLETDLSKGGDPHPQMHSMAHRCRGRLLAASGDGGQAEAAFEESVASASRADLWLLEALAIRDLTESVLRPVGREMEGERRLERVAARLVSPVAEVRRLP